MNLLESLKHNIAAALSDTKAYDLPIVCTSLGLADGDQQEAHASKLNTFFDACGRLAKTTR